MADFPDLDWPLMRYNIPRSDLDDLVRFLSGDPVLTAKTQVREFEREWSEWLGVEHSVFVNSGSSANLLTMAALKELRGAGEVIVPPLTWVSDIASILQAGLTPVFADIDICTLGLDTDEVLRKLNDDTRAVFITHALGYNALTDELLGELADREVPLIEDACESHGATFNGRKVGSIGWISNFSFYYAHHMSTIEGGMISTDDAEVYEVVRMMRAHGMVRESDSVEVRNDYAERCPDLSPDFIFAYPAYNVRPTEINAVLGRSQLRRLDANNAVRQRNLATFLESLDGEKYQTDFAVEGSSNYALTLVLRQPNDTLRDAAAAALRAMRVEFRRGLSGGGNQLRQPYLRKIVGESAHREFPVTEHVHFFGFYIGNYPGLEESKIRDLCRVLNEL